MVYEGMGADQLKAENVDRAIKGIALNSYTLRKLLMTGSTKAWQNSYYRESDKTFRIDTDIPRGAQFPQDHNLNEKLSVFQDKRGLETFILEEDIKADNVDHIQRALKRLADRIARSVDATIYTALTTDNGRTLAASATWDNATRASRIPHEDLFRARALLADSNNNSYKADSALFSEGDWPYIVSNDTIMDSFDASGPNVMQNGNMGRIAGLEATVSVSVDADEACVMQSKVAGTWFALEGMKTFRKEDPGIGVLVRAWEYGAVAITDPSAICIITNTRA